TKVPFREAALFAENRAMSRILAAKLPAKPPLSSDMVWIPAGMFLMGSDRHYPEEAPAHKVQAAGFWVDRTPVTNREFRRFVEATGHVTFAEIAPDPKDYPVRCRTCCRPARWCSRRPGVRWT
ncbi:MAG TPA: SUMF1/EgtB/PvdO family nonheme iron enzyme, partial [Burkholderiaceae bacterium]